MNTSEPLLQLDEAAVSTAKSAVGAALPDVGALTQMANEFFRALPGQTLSNAGSQVPSLNSFAGGANPALPGVTSGHLPQAGFPAPSLAPVPSVDKIPDAADLAHFSFADPSAAQTNAFAGLKPAGSPIPAQAPLPSQGFNSQTPFAPSGASPFSMPLPEFGAAFPHFESPVPAIPALPALSSADASAYSQTAASHLYFVEHAGVMSKPRPESPRRINQSNLIRLWCRTSVRFAGTST